MLSIALPKAPKYEEIDANTGRFVIEGCYPGYGTTIGNSLRRTLLSSLPGTAITAVKIKGVTHEFTTLKGVKEDTVQIILNLKQVRFKLNDVEEATVFLKAKGEKKVTAKDIKGDSEVEVVNPDHLIATLTSSTASLEMELKLERGLGYLPVEQQMRDEREIGTIAIDAIYNPVKRVNFKVENMRVGKRTDYDKVTLEVVTDGSVSPQEAYEKATQILISQFESVAQIRQEEKVEAKELEVEFDDAEEKMVEEMEEEINGSEEEKTEALPKLNTLNFSTRTLNILESNGIKEVERLADMTDEELLELEGMGEKGVKEVKKIIGGLGITLKSTEE